VQEKRVRKTYVIELGSKSEILFLDVEISGAENNQKISLEQGIQDRPYHIKLTHIKPNKSLQNDTLNNKLLFSIRRDQAGKFHFSEFEFDMDEFNKTIETKKVRLATDAFSFLTSFISGYALNKLLISNSHIGVDKIAPGVAAWAPGLNIAVGVFAFIYYVLGCFRSYQGIKKAEKKLVKINTKINELNTEIANEVQKLHPNQLYLEFLSEKLKYLETTAKREKIQQKRCTVRRALYVIGIGISLLSLAAGIGILLGGSGLFFTIVPYLVVALGLAFSIVNTWYARKKGKNEGEASNHISKMKTLLEEIEKGPRLEQIKKEIAAMEEELAQNRAEDAEEIKGDLLAQLLLKTQELEEYHSIKSNIRDKKSNNLLWKDLLPRLGLLIGLVASEIITPGTALIVFSALALFFQTCITGVQLWFLGRSVESLSSKPEMLSSIGDWGKLTIPVNGEMNGGLLNETIKIGTKIMHRGGKLGLKGTTLAVKNIVESDLLTQILKKGPFEDGITWFDKKIQEANEVEGSDQKNIKLENLLMLAEKHTLTEQVKVIHEHLDGIKNEIDEQLLANAAAVDHIPSNSKQKEPDQSTQQPSISDNPSSFFGNTHQSKEKMAPSVPIAFGPRRTSSG